ncbi:hypothetical protein VTK73DRAFT_3635 [Phialemonium thermophilum]|uniref:ceramidase n=1 Tax=Phialemonium thermophilum TaxID=223376 RepID=A0ABR3WYF7_9PEZI
MESAGLRRQHRTQRQSSGPMEQRDRNSSHTANGRKPSSDPPIPAVLARFSDRQPGFFPPKFTVDLSLPPEQRYAHVAPHFLPHLATAQLSDLFDDLVRDLVPDRVTSRLVLLAAPLLLRRLYSDEETAELRGIAAATGLSMHHLVAFNVLLDLLLGCTSGAARVVFDEDDKYRRLSSASPSPSRLLHFRTLDWGMDPLRHLVVELDYVQGGAGRAGANPFVVATSVTYFGYVGVLTGVRRGLSLSLNFRPHHDTSTLRKALAFRWHQLLVVLGRRRSVSSTLRQYLLSPTAGSTPPGQQVRDRSHNKPDEHADVQVDVDQSIREAETARIIDELSSSPSTAAYIFLCTPQRAYSVEKDHRAASIATSETFLTVCNHDVADEEVPESGSPSLANAAHHLEEIDATTGMGSIVAYSVTRKDHVARLFEEAVERRRRLRQQQQLLPLPPSSVGKAVLVKDVLKMVQDPSVSNEETHFAAIMDPMTGRVLWRRAYLPGDIE